MARVTEATGNPPGALVLAALTGLGKGRHVPVRGRFSLAQCQVCCTGATPNPQTWSAQLCRLVPWAQTCLLPCLLGKHQLRRVGLGEWGSSPGLRPWPTVTPRRAGHLSHGSPPLCEAQGHSLEINPAVPEYISAHRPCLIDFIDFLLLLCPSQATSRVALHS